MILYKLDIKLINFNKNFNMKTNLLSIQQKVSYISIVALFLAGNFGQAHAQGADNALTFDGVDDIVIVPSSSGGDLNPIDSLTLECWVYLNEATSATHRPHLLSKIGSFALILEDNSLPRFFIHDGTTWQFVEGTTSIQVNKWYHIAGTYDGENIKIYVNGQLDGTPTELIGSMVVNDADFNIGHRTNNEEALNGAMDEVRAWTLTMSEQEIQESMNSTLVGDETELVGYWRFDETTGTVATDSSPKGNDGTLTNMAPETAWSTSTAPLGDASILSISDAIMETDKCEVDVYFGTDDDAPGDGFSLAAMQVNSPPNDITGLTNIADTYWELWTEDHMFDGTFSLTVNFHYDNISGIDDETQLELFRRDSATSSTWKKVNGYTIVSDDGGSSSTTDGIGYVQMTISQDTLGGFSGQYILSGSNTLDVVEFSENLDIKLYPNPNNGSFSVELSLDETQNIKLQVLSINGKLVWSEMYRNQVGNRRYPINIENSAKGIYVLKVSAGTGSFTKQLIIQ